MGYQVWEKEKKYSLQNGIETMGRSERVLEKLLSNEASH